MRLMRNSCYVIMTDESRQRIMENGVHEGVEHGTGSADGQTTSTAAQVGLKTLTAEQTGLKSTKALLRTTRVGQVEQPK